MTLIVTALSPGRVVQVSDRRLTFPNGRKYTDNANKAVVVYCDDGYFSVAYTGLAYIYDQETKFRKKTDEWIAHSMWSIMQRPGRWGVQELYRAFAKRAEEAFELTRDVPLTRKATAFVIAGFIYWKTPNGQILGNAVAGSLSNMKITGAGNIKVVRSFESRKTWAPGSSMHANKIEIWIDGTEAAVASKDTIAKSINRRTKVIRRRLERVEHGTVERSREDVANALVHVVRLATHHPDYGKYIGRDCIAVGCLHSNLEVFADTYKENSVEHDTPIIVTRELVGKGSWSIRQPATSL